MTHIPKGQLIADGEYCKHLRKWGRRHFWHRHRLAERREINRLERENLTTYESKIGKPFVFSPLKDTLLSR